MRVVFLLLKRSPFVFLLAVGMGILGGGTTVVLLSVVGDLLRGAGHGREMIVVFGVLCAARLVLSIVSHLVIVRLSAGFTYDLSLQIIDRILRTPLRTVEAIGTPRLLAVFSKDIGAIADIIVTMPYLMVNTIVVLGCLGYIGLHSWRTCLGLLVCILLGIATYSMPILFARCCLRQGREATDSLFRCFQAVVEGIKELQLHRARRQAFVQHVLIESAGKVKKYFVTGVSIYAIASHWNRLLFFVYVGLLLFVMPVGTTIETGRMGEFVLVMLYMMAPLEAIQNALPGLGQADVSLKKIEGMGLSLIEEGSVLPITPPVSSAHMWRMVRLHEATYSYGSESDGDRFTLGPITLTLNRGELVFLVGGNGSGKTTLVKVLVGLYQPEAGHIYLDDVEITDQNRELYREQFTAVFQDFWVFDSLVGFDKTAELDMNANRWLAALRLQEKVKIRSGILSTIDLSRGQRKRLALLTGLLEDRPFYVFDEWAADQDPLYKQVFYEHMLPDLKAKGKAVLVITHDDGYWHLADRVIKLESGRPAG